MLLEVATAGRALLDPLVGVPTTVDRRHWVLPLLALCLASALSGTVYGLKLDTARQVVPAMAQKGDLAKASEREISDKVEQAQRIALVAGVAKGALAMPLLMVLLAAALKLVAWLLVKPLPFASAFTVVALSTLPIALFQLIFAVAIVQQDFVTVKSAEQLVPSSLAFLAEAPGALQRAWGAVDFFKLWSAVLLGLGFARATGVRWWRGIVLGLFLYVCFAAVLLVGLPGLAESMGDAGGGGPRR